MSESASQHKGRGGISSREFASSTTKVAIHECILMNFPAFNYFLLDSVLLCMLLSQLKTEHGQGGNRSAPGVVRP